MKNNYITIEDVYRDLKEYLNIKDFCIKTEENKNGEIISKTLTTYLRMTSNKNASFCQVMEFSIYPIFKVYGKGYYKNRFNIINEDKTIFIEDVTKSFIKTFFKNTYITHY